MESVSGVATVCRIEAITKHPNADRLLLGKVLGTQVIVGLDQKEGDLGIVFDSDCQLSEEFCTIHDLVEQHDKETGKKIGGGYFDASRRVRPKNFRGVKSFMYFVPLSWVEYTGVDVSSLKEGDQLTQLNGHELCTKYIVKQQKSSGSGEKVFRFRKRKRCPLFLEHFNTPHLRNHLHEVLEKGARIIISGKIHATSGRLGYLPDENPLCLLEKLPWRWRNRKLIYRFVNYVEGLANKMYKMFVPVSYAHFIGSRHVTVGTLEDNVSRQGFHGKEDWRFDAVRDLQNKLYAGETLYFELCYTDEQGNPLMPPVYHDALPKELQKLYPNPMKFTYGVPSGHTRIFVYRITRIDDQGVSYDLWWDEVEERCRELGILTVPLVGEILTVSEENFPTIEKALLENNIDLERYITGPDPLDPTHLKEGVCLRVEHEAYGIWIYKHKSYDFLVCEGIIKDKGFIDIEEQESLQESEEYV